MQTTRTPYSISFMATVLLLLLFACHSTVANAAVALGATRVIYPANQKQVLLPVTNNDPASVYLIQSWIENSGDQKDTQFVITPPLFSMQGKKENTLRIINATNHQLPGDRESLFWVNVKAIPAMEKDQKNENTLQLAIISRIKMFYRPTNLAMAPEEAPAMLRFRRSGSKLTLINPTPYFITVTNMKAGNSNLPNTMVPPKGEVSVDIPHAATGDISFQTINDYGALTPRIKFPTTGSTSPVVPFQITLSECSKGTTGVRVAFNGIEDAENNTLLKLDEGSNTASGLGIEILDANMRPVKLNDLHAGMQWIPLVPEQNNILPYSARLKSTQKSVNPGLVRASATFTLEFQ